MKLTGKIFIQAYGETASCELRYIEVKTVKELNEILELLGSE